jgi:hypothetical protein
MAMYEDICYTDAIPTLQNSPRVFAPKPWIVTRGEYNENL